MTTVVHGWDLSLNHAGMVELEDGEPSWFRYVTSQAGAANKSKKHGVRLKLGVPSKFKDKQHLNAIRIAWWERFIWDVLEERKPDFVGIEDYALDLSQGAHYLGELGGIARLMLMIHKIPFRLHEPQTVKMFTAHNGNAGKNQMERAARERWGLDFREFNQPVKANAKKGPDTTVCEDLADALSVAKLVWAEVQIRRGDMTTNDLGHEKEIQVFNRVTKAYPVNLLSREWIRQEVEGS